MAVTFTSMTKGLSNYTVSEIQRKAEMGEALSASTAQKKTLYDYFQKQATERIREKAYTGSKLDSTNAWKQGIYNNFLKEFESKNQNYQNNLPQTNTPPAEKPIDYQAMYQQQYQNQYNQQYEQMQNLYNQNLGQYQQDFQGKIDGLNSQWEGMFNQNNQQWQGKLDQALQNYQNQMQQNQGIFDQQIKDWGTKYDDLNKLMENNMGAANDKYNALQDKYNYLSSINKNQNGNTQGVDTGTGAGNKQPEMVSNVTKENSTNDNLYKYLNNIWNGGF